MCTNWWHMFNRFYRATLCVNAVFAVIRCPSVRLSVTFMYCIQMAKDITKLLSRPDSPHHSSFFDSQHRYPIPRGTLSAKAQNTLYTRVGKFAMVDWNLGKVRDKPMVGGTLIGSHRRRIDPCRFRWPWVTHNPGYKVTVYLQVEYVYD